MTSVDITINDDCVVREDRSSDHTPQRFELRVGEPGWHRNAALLTPEQALKLRDELNRFLEQHGLA